MRILLAIDGSELSRHAVDYVVKHRDSLALDAHVTCLYVVGPVSPRPGGMGRAG